MDELEVLAMNEQEIREALIEWEKLSASVGNKHAYEMRLKFLRNQLSNIRGERWEGLEEGLKKGAISSATLIAKGMDAKDIIDIIGLSEGKLKSWPNRVRAMFFRGNKNALRN
jgi:hypothetical protein